MIHIITSPLLDLKEFKDFWFLMRNPVCSSPFMTSSNLSPLNRAVVGLSDLD